MTATLSFDGSQPAGDVGFYSYDVADDHWSWSEGLYALHGYAPREVPATTEVLLSHKHPDDRTRAFEVLEQAVQDGKPFSCYHRIIDFHQRLRYVLSVGHGIRDGGGRVERVEGFFVDLTAVRRDETEAEVSLALQRVAEHRETIDLAKGMVMLATACDAVEAFQVLRRHSQRANVKLHDVAQRLVEQVQAGEGDATQVLSVLDSVQRT
jgi:ANTAR domain/PAS fold